MDAGLVCPPLPEHGGYGKMLGAKLDFSANINPLGIPESVKRAVTGSVHDWERYPDPQCMELKLRLAEYYHLDPSNIVCGNGADDLIYRIVQAVRPKKALICTPSFSEYEKALREYGSEVEYYRLRPEFSFDVQEDIFRHIGPDTDLVFLCNPNNPTGRVCSREFAGSLIETALSCNALIICDECFMEFVQCAQESSMAGFLKKNVIVLRAFTKFCAMPGLRLGFALFGDPGLAKSVERTGQYWSVSAPALAAGIAAIKELSASGYASKTRLLIALERRYLEAGLEKAGIKYIRSAANFILIYSERPIYSELIKKGILIRDCSDFKGLGTGWYRIAVRTHEENKCLVRALDPDAFL